MDIPRHWRLKAQRYRLEGSFCPACGELFFPPRPVCPRCSNKPLRLFGLPLSQALAPDRILLSDVMKGS